MEEKRICPACNWRGFASETVHPKNWDLVKLCPDCNTVTELTFSTKGIIQ